MTITICPYYSFFEPSREGYKMIKVYCDHGEISTNYEYLKTLNEKTTLRTFGLYDFPICDAYKEKIGCLRHHKGN